MNPQVRLVTARHLPELAPDDQHLLAALTDRGVRTRVQVWDDPDVDWSLAPVTVIRSVFDYHLRQPEFLAWVDRVEPLTSLQNAPEIIRWNSHKSYLRRLADDGFPTIPTEWVTRGETLDLAQILARRGWTEAVVKPAVSASAHGTIKVTPGTLDEAQAHLNGLTQAGDALVQPYLYEFETVGESALVWLGGRHSHDVRRPSGIHTSLEVAHEGAVLQPTPGEVALATRAFEWITPTPLYARIDLLDTQEHGLLVLELELIEPALYLRHDRAIAERCANAVIALL
jgi:hypothetical protein